MRQSSSALVATPVMPHELSWSSPTQQHLTYHLKLSSPCSPVREDRVTPTPTVNNPSISTSAAFPRDTFRRRQSQQSHLAKVAMTTNGNNFIQQQQQRQNSSEEQHGASNTVALSQDTALRAQSVQSLDMAKPRENDSIMPTTINTTNPTPPSSNNSRPHSTALRGASLATALRAVSNEMSVALNDTPATTAPNSPWMKGNISIAHTDSIPTTLLSLGAAVRHNSGTSTPRIRPTTLDIPGLTKSKVSPDGKIAQRDVGSKLVIVMVGLPARGKSYITKKLARYLNWLQHDTKIFNVGERRRNVAGGPNNIERAKSPRPDAKRTSQAYLEEKEESDARPATVSRILLNDDATSDLTSTPTQTTYDEAIPNGASPALLQRSETEQSLATKVLAIDKTENERKEEEAMEHNAAFFDPFNKKAAQIREQVARETLDELLDYILEGNGSVGILDATNSTLERRQMIMDHIRARAGPALNVLFLESRCEDKELLEANMRLKLNGPDYREMDPAIALADFKKRVQEYEKAYVPLGDYEEKHNMPFVQMIDVGRKVISHQIRGFLMAQANYYLLNFNLAPRQIWITRHGLSMDNLSGKIGGDSDLAPEGHEYAKALSAFMDVKRREWDLKQIENIQKTHFPPQPGDVTPPNPYYHLSSPTLEKSLDDALSTTSDTTATTTSTTDLTYDPINFCVWTSMLQRSIQTAQYFNDDDYDSKEMRMLDELNAGVMEGLTYSSIQSQYPEEYRRRKDDKLHYRYPGAGGEGYLDIINRLRPVIVELERMTDHVLLVGHRSVARVLLAYFLGLGREVVADLDVPIGMLYCLEPKPYGVDFKAYRWNRAEGWFDEVPDFKLSRAENDME